MPKFAIVFVIVCMTCGCTSSRIKPVFLHSVEETGNVMNRVTQMLAPREPLATEIAAAREMEADSFLVFDFEHKMRNREAEERARSESNGMLPEVDLLDSRTLMMAVYKSNELFLLVDENNNNRLDDEQAVKVDPAITKTQQFDDLSLLPQFRVQGLKTIYQGKEVFFRKSFYLLPNITRDSLLNLLMVSNEQKQGEFRYKKRPYTVRARNNMSHVFNPGTSQVMLRVDSLQCPPGAAYDLTRTGYMHDTLTAGSTRFVVTGMSAFTELLTIEAIPAVKTKKKAKSAKAVTDSTGK
ncbi:MAG: hypothetical protein EOO09_17045 [Chitinophagaceae bacterium]|nr:MAG: hypothetical protein EOO09_17045 [Chitinophagaceae bacterium]